MSKSLKLETDSYTFDFDISRGDVAVVDGNVSDDAVNMALLVVTVVMVSERGKMLESFSRFEYDAGIIELFINAHK